MNPPPQVQSLLEALPALAQLEEQLTVVSYILNQSHQRVTRSNRVGWTIHSSSSGLGQSAVNRLTRVRIPVSELCIYGQVVRRLFSKEKIVRSNRTRCTTGWRSGLACRAHRKWQFSPFQNDPKVRFPVIFRISQGCKN